MMGARPSRSLSCGLIRVRTGALAQLRESGSRPLTCRPSAPNGNSLRITPDRNEFHIELMALMTQVTKLTTEQKFIKRWIRVLNEHRLQIAFRRK